MNIPIFDSLTHPTIDGNWILPRYANESKKDILLSQMQEANVKWTFAVGMKGIGSYSQVEFIKYFNNLTDYFLYPIAYFDACCYQSYDEIKKELSQIKSIGYKGIKLHPRMSDFSYEDTQISTIIKIANDFNLISLLCTYPYSNSKACRNTPENLMEMLHRIDKAKVVLLHSGAVRLLEYMEIARAFSNVLLDLSLTICKYEGSSVDMDISFLFKYFDRRIAIGSDFPEYSLNKLRERFEYFTLNLPKEKIENIAYKNIIEFCEL